MALTTLATDPAAVGSWTLVPQRSSIRFANKTMWGLIPVNGRFTDVSGSGRVEADGTITGRLIIRADSVRTGIGARDRHLTHADFFDAENHPEITVEVTGAEARLSVRGTTLAVPLETTVTRLDDTTVQITARGQIDRTRWGVSGNMAGMMPATTTLVAETVFSKSG